MQHDEGRHETMRTTLLTRNMIRYENETQTRSDMHVPIVSKNMKIIDSHRDPVAVVRCRQVVMIMLVLSS